MNINTFYSTKTNLTIIILQYVYNIFNFLLHTIINLSILSIPYIETIMNIGTFTNRYLDKDSNILTNKNIPI